MTIDTERLEESIQELEQAQLPAKTNGEARQMTPVEKALLACSSPLDQLFDHFEQQLDGLERAVQTTHDRVRTHRKNVSNRLHDLVLLSNDIREVHISISERLADIEDAVKKVGA